MGKRKDLSDFDKGQIVMARQLGQSISKTAALVGCSWSAVVSIYQKWSNEGTVVNWRQGHGRPRLNDARGERRLAHVDLYNRRATVAQISQEVNAGSDRKVSEYTVHRSLLRMGLHSCRPVRMPMLTPVHCRKRQQWAREHQNWTTEQWKKVAWSDESRFLLHHVDGRVHVRHNTILGSSKPEPDVKNDELMCEEHQEEKINIYCVTCSVPTCSLCKVFGSHQSCEVAPLKSVYETQKTELSDGVAVLVANNDRIQGIISQLEESCRSVEENGRRQKSRVCEWFDRLYALLEERRGDLTLKITAEQQEKLDYISGLQRKYREHLDNAAKLVETGIQTMEESEMAIFLQNTKPLLQKIAEGRNVSHLEKVERGYENMDHFTANFQPERRAILSIDFIRDGDNNEEDDDEEELAGTVIPETQASSRTTPIPQRQTPVPNLPAMTADTSQMSSKPNQSVNINPAENTPLFTPTPDSSLNPSTDAPAQGTASPSQTSEDGPRHVFSFSWLNVPK